MSLGLFRSTHKISLYSVEIMTSTVDIKDDSRGRPVQKAKVYVVLLSCFVSLEKQFHIYFGIKVYFCDFHLNVSHSLTLIFGP